MQKITIKVNAKINLALDITGVRQNGYHELDMLMTSVNVYDILHAKKSESNLVLMDGKVATKDNTALKALELISDRYGVHMQVDIQKGIPFSSGMGGSSADASGVFYCAYRLYNLHIDDMLDLALKVGCDVPYMIYGGDARVKGIGEEIAPLTFPKMHMVIAQKKCGASTGEIYKLYDKIGGEKNNTIDNIIGNIDGKFSTFNVLEKSAIALSEGIEEAKAQLKKYTDRVFMTGSGSAYVGIFDTILEAEECAEKLQGMQYKIATSSADKGIEEINFDM